MPWSEWMSPPLVAVNPYTQLTRLSSRCEMSSKHASASVADAFGSSSIYDVFEAHGAVETEPTDEVGWMLTGLTPLYQRRDSVYFHRVWIPGATASAINSYVPPNLPPGSSVEYRGAASIASMQWTARIRQAPNLTYRQATGGNVQWRLGTKDPLLAAAANGTIPAHAEVTPSGRLLASWDATGSIAAYPTTATDFTVTGAEMPNPDPVTYPGEYWLRSYHSIDLHGSVSQVYPVDHGDWVLDEVPKTGNSAMLQPREYRVFTRADATPNLGGVAGPQRRYFRTRT